METTEHCPQSHESTPSPTGTGDGWDELRELFDDYDEGLLPPSFENSHDVSVAHDASAMVHDQADERVKSEPVQSFQWCNADGSLSVPEDPDSLVFGASPSPSNSDVGGTDSDGGEASHFSSDDPREDKKRRNREAAKLSRAKKKRMLQSIEERQDELEREQSALKRENQTLRYMNQALEGQVAYFHGLFKAAFNNGHLSKLPETAFDSAWHVANQNAFTFGSSSKSSIDKPPVPAPRGASLAMAVVFLAAVSVGKLGDIDLAPPPSVLVNSPPMHHGRGAGRMLLAVEDVEPLPADSSFSLMQLLQMLHLPLVFFAVVALLAVSVSAGRRMLLARQNSEPVLPTQAAARKSKVQ